MGDPFRRHENFHILIYSFDNLIFKKHISNMWQNIMYTERCTYVVQRLLHVSPKMPKNRNKAVRGGNERIMGTFSTSGKFIRGKNFILFSKDITPGWDGRQCPRGWMNETDCLEGATRSSVYAFSALVESRVLEQSSSINAHSPGRELGAGGQ